MQEEGVWLYSVTFDGVLYACASADALEEGRCTHEQIMESLCNSDIFVGNILVGMYVKCGSMEEAWRVSDKMPGIKLW
jgi:pentatricopeptide repeat protein